MLSNSPFLMKNIARVTFRHIIWGTADISKATGIVNTQMVSTVECLREQSMAGRS